mmetsp:Transcript_19030/g.24560  ORF Transcript_19030/g.24560 Transcript_19030/m.24560 type:complete len:228 (-) Transcript_19030:65-748(-)
MAIRIGSEIPNFRADTNLGPIELHEYFGDSWGILFSHPDDFTPVCTTELGEAARLAPEFEKRNVKMIALSCNDVSSHNKWIEDIKAATGQDVTYPIIGDTERKVATKMGMLDNHNRNAAGLPLTVRSVFIVDPDKVVKLELAYPATTGRNFYEILRCIDSLQLTFDGSLATPVNWKRGDDCVISPKISTEDAKQKYEKMTEVTLPSEKPYLRFTPDPNSPPKKCVIS